ncbi:2-oxo acid dehydrogenase subunit E2 [bacterium]|nr:MAG: 2-oxo acid dehydrogenase subunit E2 [bacterium]
MAREQMVMPKMGESIMEGTVIEWKKKVGDSVELDETVLEIATDKVDSEVPAPIAGIIVEILAEEGETVEVGKPIAIIETDASAAASAPAPKEEPKAAPAVEKTPEPTPVAAPAPVETPTESQKDDDGRFYSPLVRSIAKEEGLNQADLDAIKGTGSNGRVTKADVLDYISAKKSGTSTPSISAPAPAPQPMAAPAPAAGKIHAGELNISSPQNNVEVVKMDRMRKLIAEHMIRSKQTSAHVTTFNEADVTRLVQYRQKNKNEFQKKYGFSLTYTPFFVEATIQALKEFPLLNSSVDGDSILIKKGINYGIAVALGEAGVGGLIVPVIKNAGEMNLYGLAKSVSELAGKARTKSLSPEDLVGGTFTLTNYGSVGNLMGTPIINQPQVAIFGTGAIVKRPVVIEQPEGDVIAIRHMVYLSMSYDHRIIDGAMGGAFLQRVKQLLEEFDMNRSI